MLDEGQALDTVIGCGLGSRPAASSSTVSINASRGPDRVWVLFIPMAISNVAAGHWWP